MGDIDGLLPPQLPKLRRYARSLTRNKPGFARWVDTIPSKGLEMLEKTPIPTFTRCPATLSPVRIPQAIEVKGKYT